jgi:hypothetical protein
VFYTYLVDVLFLEDDTQCTETCSRCNDSNVLPVLLNTVHIARNCISYSLTSKEVFLFWVSSMHNAYP